MLKVHQPSLEVLEMRTEWAVIDALMGGTRGMRAAGQTLLPPWPNEEQAAYSIRLNTATLYPAFRRTVRVMAGKPFSKAVNLGEDVPEPIQALAEDIDAQGNSLHVFISRLAEEAIAWGLAGVLVDFSRTGGIASNLAEEKAIGARPYFVRVRHDQILGWKTERTIDGVQRLSQLRIAETAEIEDGEYGTKEVKRVRVLEPGTFQVWQELERNPDEYELIDQGPMAPLTEIPFVPFYGEETGFMKAASPLMDLAYLNVRHWQSQSDQDTLLHVARVPILVVIGGDQDKHLTVSAGIAMSLPQGGDMKYVEHSGAAIGAGQASLEALEAQMIQTGAELLVPNPGTRTATEANNDAEGNKSDLQRIIENMEDGVDRCLQFMAQWLRLPDGGKASLFKDFGAMTLSDATAQLVLACQQGGLVSKVTAINELKRRGILSGDVDADEEIDAAAAEGPALGMIGVQDAANQEDQEAA